MKGIEIANYIIGDCQNCKNEKLCEHDYSNKVADLCEEERQRRFNALPEVVEKSEYERIKKENEELKNKVGFLESKIEDLRYDIMEISERGEL